MTEPEPDDEIEAIVLGVLIALLFMVVVGTWLTYVNSLYSQ